MSFRFKPFGALALALLLFSLLLPATASAGPWTRDQGHFYLNLNYSRIRAVRVYGPDFNHLDTATFTQHAMSLYGEVGLVSQWLTASVEGQLYRRNELIATDAPGFRAHTEGLGDFRLGLWSGLVTKPLRVTVAFLIGFPLGDNSPGSAEQVGRNSSAIKDAVEATACLLPTGDGEFDFEWRASLGYSFGGWRRWPLRHYVLGEAGYRLRTTSRPRSAACTALSNPEGVNWPDDFVYRFEFGIQFPWKFIDRFWFIGRLQGVESFATAADLRPGGVCDLGGAFSGLGPCVTFVSYGFDVYGRIWKGLGASIGLDSAFRGRLVPAGANLKVALSYEY